MAEHKISDEVMANTELLAKLALTDEEREKSRQEMEKILGYVDKLNELDTEGVEPLTTSPDVYLLISMSAPAPVGQKMVSVNPWFTRILRIFLASSTFGITTMMMLMTFSPFLFSLPNVQINRPQVYALLRSVLNESHWDSAPCAFHALSLLTQLLSEAYGSTFHFGPR